MTDTLTPEAAFAEALAAFQGDMPEVEKQTTGQAGQRQTKYADLAHITERAMPKLAAHGLSYTAAPTLTPDGRFVLRFALLHKAGHRESGDFPLPDSATSQQMGSAITYARRYCLLSVTGIAPKDDDDDGHQASDVVTAPQRAQRRNARDINPATDPDMFAVPVTDIAWLADVRTRLDLCGSAAEVRGLWAEMVQVYGEHRLTADDRGALERDMTARMTELKPAEVPA